MTAAALLVALAAGLAAASAAPEQGRRLRRIETVERPLSEVYDAAPPLPGVYRCEDAIRTIAAAYGAGDIDRYLDEEFPNRAELLDALQRADLRVTNVELRVESVENARFLPWLLLDTTIDGDRTIHTIGADCVAEVRLRAAFDGAASGERAVTDVSSGEWRVRFTRRLIEPGETSR
jgi:hypothetical protein